MTRLVLIALFALSVLNVVVAAANLRNSRRNAENAQRNYEVAVVLEPGSIDSKAVLRAIKRRGGGAA